MAGPIKHNVLRPRNDVSPATLREHFEYNEDGGGVRRVLRCGKSGWVSKTGYRYHTFKGVSYKEHRLVWVVCHGDWPNNQIDHINGDKQDNRIENLRDVCGSRNQWNIKQTPGETGVVGVSRLRGKYQATIKHKGKKIFLGYYDCLQEAALARAQAEARLRA